MSSKTRRQLMALRRAAISRITAQAAKYKVCEHCKSISAVETAVCGLCRSYCWLEGEETVRAIAAEMCQSPFPMTLGFPPRLQKPVVGVSYLGRVQPIG